MRQRDQGPATTGGAARPPRRRLLRAGAWVAGVVTVLVLTVVVAFQVSYWPTTLLVRYSPDVNGQAALEALEAHVPDGVTGVLDEEYAPDDPDARLDVFYPDGTGEGLPTVVWVHGGAFVAGTKDGTTAYAQILASHGYTVASVEYTKAPEGRYPHQVQQVSAALDHLVAHADRLHVDTDRVVLAGDSAGAHIASQTALAISDDGYAEAAGLPQALDAQQLRGVVLACGAFDLTIPDYSDGMLGRVQRNLLWAYTGEKDFDQDPRIAYASIPQHVTSAYPPTFITAGNADPLEPHSRSLAEALEAEGVPVDALLFAADREPAVGHEYQFDLDRPEGQEALDRILTFLDTVTTEES
jgi:acetyl esterase/lipase